MRRALPFFLLIAAIGIGGCSRGFKYIKVAPRPAIHRAVSLSPSTSEIAAIVGGASFLQGRTASDDYPSYVLKSIPIVASVKPDYEKIKAMQPDLILYDSSLFSDADVQKIKDLGFDTFAFNPKNVQDFEHQLFEFANKTGFQTQVSDYVDRIDVSLGNAAPPPSPSPKVAIIMPGHGGPAMIAGTQTFTADVFKEVGGTPVGPDVNRFVTLNPETLASLNPDVIVIPTTKNEATHDLQSVASDPKYKSTNAVKNGRIVAMDEDIALRAGERVNNLIDGAYKAVATQGTAAAAGQASTGGTGAQ
jgi:iron complex transport system substrate-binding protein